MININIQNTIVFTSLLCLIGCQEIEEKLQITEGEIPQQTDTDSGTENPDEDPTSEVVGELSPDTESPNNESEADTETGSPADETDPEPVSSTDGLAKFDDLTKDQLSLVLQSAQGEPGTLLHVYTFMAQQDHEESRCPQRVEEGDDIIFEGNGCVASSGDIYNGQVRLSKDCFSLSSDSYCEMESNSFSVDNGVVSYEFDGWTVSGHIGNFTEGAMDISLKIGKVDSITKIYSSLNYEMKISDDNDYLSKFSSGEGFVDGIGGFSFDSEFVQNENNEDENIWIFQIEGVDSLNFQYDEDEDCFAYTTESSEDSLCE